MGRWRVVLAVAGILLGVFGIGRLVTEIPSYSLKWLAVWLIAAVLIHDGVLSPLIVAVGWFLREHVPPRGRRYLQAALIMAAMVTVIAIPMIYRRDSQPVSKAILNQNFGANLTLLLGIIAGATLLAYAIRVARDQSESTSPSSGSERHGDREPPREA